MIFRTLSVFTIKLDRPKLAKDAKTIIRIFEILEEEGIPSECQAVNIDWLAITMREEYRSKMSEFLRKLVSEISEINVSIGDVFTLLCIEGEALTSRMIGLIAGSLSLENIEVRMFRQIKGNEKLVIGLNTEDIDDAKDIIMGV